MTLPVELPPPRNWQDFEDFCCELFSAEWGDPHTEKHGRPGEAQNGVDVFGQCDGEWHAVQCKRRRLFPEASLSEKDVRDEIEAARSQSRTLSSLVVATTAPRSTAHGNLAALLTEETGFRVEVYGWAELVRRLQRHEDLFHRWRELLGGAGLPHFVGVPRRNPHFQGRDGLLEDLARNLGGGGTTFLSQAIDGLGGIGKTQTAIEYCHRHRDRYHHLIWATASSPEELAARYAELARLGGLAGPAAPVEQAAASFLRWLSIRSSWLLVLDNVEDQPQGLVLPRVLAGTC